MRYEFSEITEDLIGRDICGLSHNGTPLDRHDDARLLGQDSTIRIGAVFWVPETNVIVLGLSQEQRDLRSGDSTGWSVEFGIGEGGWIEVMDDDS